MANGLTEKLKGIGTTVSRISDDEIAKELMDEEQPVIQARKEEGSEFLIEVGINYLDSKGVISRRNVNDSKLDKIAQLYGLVKAGKYLSAGLLYYLPIQKGLTKEEKRARFEEFKSQFIELSQKVWGYRDAYLGEWVVKHVIWGPYRNQKNS